MIRGLAQALETRFVTVVKRNYELQKNLRHFAKVNLKWRPSYRDIYGNTFSNDAHLTTMKYKW